MTSPPNRKILTVSLMIIFVITIVLLVIKYTTANTKTIAESIAYETATEETTDLQILKEAETVRIHIVGEVNNPNVYTVPSDYRIIDVVENAAGGFTENADRSAINLADFITDGQQITIPSLKSKDTDSSPVYSELPSLESSLININTASLSELMTLKGIGESKASAIIEYRKISKFTSIEDIKNVSGIGDKLFENIKDEITVGHP